jgi:bifunctional UDP-N-acetylglucosamine pyrophosphorylase/glucosamine-1-phosphate N-acetyltransferase
VNTGIYCMDWPKLSELLVKRAQARHAYQNAQGELYLTDLVQDTVEAAYPVKACQLQEPTEMIGVNSRQDLAQCHQYLAQRQVQRWMSDGVTIIDPSSTWIGPDVSLGPDTILYPGCWLEGHVSVGQGCVLGPDVTVQGDVTFGNSVTVTHSVFHAKTSQIRVADGAMVGPFAHIRDGSVGSHIGSGSRIGNFVELKNAQIAEQTNVAHLSYLGDVEVGRQVNIGAGTIVANYDALQEQKHQTRIEDHVKVGSNTVLVAPVTLGQEAFIAAGSVITKSVEPGALGIARGRQENRTGWVYQQREQNQVNAPCQK